MDLSNIKTNRMKRELLIISASISFLFLATQYGFAQGMAINSTGNAAAGSAILDVSSTNKGVLIPRMSQAERNIISTPATGLLIYQNDNTPGFYYYNGTSWSLLGGGAPSGPAGGDLTGTYPNPTIGTGKITNNHISSTAGITYNKLSLTNSILSTDITSNAINTGNVVNGAITLAKLSATGSASSTTFLRGDNTWAPISGSSAFTYTRVAQVANAGNTSYSVPASGVDIVGVDMSAGTNFTINLPAANTSGKYYIIKIEKFNTSLLPILTIQPNGTDKIENLNNQAFGNLGGNRRIYSDGAGNWYTW